MLRQTSYWHSQIEHEHVGRKLIIELASFFTISRFGHYFNIILRAENGSQPFPNGRVIVRNYYAYRLCLSFHWHALVKVSGANERSGMLIPVYSSRSQ
jgi:hypothetical protein